MPASKGNTSPRKRTQKGVKSSEIVETDSDTPLVASLGKKAGSSAKRKGRKAAARDSTTPSSDDGRHDPKKPCVASPFPSSPEVAASVESPDAVAISSDEEEAVVDDAAARKRTPKTPLSTAAKSSPHKSAAKSSTAKPSKTSPAKMSAARSGKQITLDDIEKSTEQTSMESGIDGAKDVDGIAWEPSEDENPLKSRSTKGKSRMRSTSPAPPVTQRSRSSRRAVELVPSIPYPPTRSQLIYPPIEGFTPPDDSDYDEQWDKFDVVDTELMPLEGQDPKLRRDYSTKVPELTFAEMMPFGQQASVNSFHYTENYSPTWAALRGDAVTRRRFRCAIRFRNHSPYVNPSRASPSLVTRDGDRLLLSTPAPQQGQRQTAVFLTAGIVSQCELVTPGWSGTSNSYQVRRIAVCPFSTEYQRAIAFIGNVMGTKMFLGALSDGNMIFGTRREGANVGSASPATPSRRGRRPITFKNAASSSTYSGSLGFHEQVPIYDAHHVEDFLFTNTNMDQLQDPTTNHVTFPPIHS
ncbi:hypothetical protein F5887DRAFT_912413 [Amanita rubescens]|nr:hypothetical protein F5887DRAFT_912413 [Amanita rubescens]